MIKNAIVIMFDSLQWNYVGAYGNTWIKTPNMDRLAREGVLFENAYTEGLPTVPCRRAMHTGRYTLPFGGWQPLTMEDTTIADLCWGRPIDTALIFDCPMYRLPKFGYTRGFDKVWFTHGHEADHMFYEEDPLYHYKVEDYFDDEVVEGIIKTKGERAFAAHKRETECYLKERQHFGTTEDDHYVAITVKKSIEYLEQVDKNKQFYLWIDSFDPHEPWDPPSVWNNFPCPYDPDYTGKDQINPICGEEDGKILISEPQLKHIRMLYAETVTVCDKWLGELMKAMRRLGLEENTLLFMVSDHGEPMGNGEHGHGLLRKGKPWPYEELVHVPFILRAPGLPAGKRVKTFVQSCDVAPTICDWLGIGVHPDMHGLSLLPVSRGETDVVRDHAVCGYNKYSWSLVTEDWSFIHWLRHGEDPRITAQRLFIDAVEKSSSALKAVGGKSFCDILDAERQDMDKAGTVSDIQSKYNDEATLDGEEQWTCTPSAEATVPDVDELYYRKEDPSQLNNVIVTQPEKAKEMFQRLREILSEIRAS